MPKFVIEREIPGAGKLSARDLQAVSQKSSRTIKQLGSKVQWVQSFVTADKTFCIYIADNEEQIKEHASHSGIPATKITQITSVIDPITAE
ncbi:MAG: DUF4242 domain-containing protein [Betaproteobacteria bacterium]|nr:DUF4242 domain-containing protein [Betaproteobacteria bacterium]